jgi:hypothetical protein
MDELDVMVDIHGQVQKRKVIEFHDLEPNDSGRSSPFSLGLSYNGIHSAAGVLGAPLANGDNKASVLQPPASVRDLWELLAHLAFVFTPSPKSQVFLGADAKGLPMDARDMVCIGNTSAIFRSYWPTSPPSPSPSPR